MAKKQYAESIGQTAIVEAEDPNIEAPPRGNYLVPAWLRGIRHCAAKEPDLFHTNLIHWHSMDGKFTAEATDGHAGIFITGEGEFTDTPGNGLLLPVELFAKCKAELADVITIEYPDFNPKNDAVQMVTASWMQPQKDELPPLPMSAGIGTVYGKFPDVKTLAAGAFGKVATRAILNLDLAKTILETVKELGRTNRFTIRSVNPGDGGMCDVYFQRDPALRDCEIRFLFKPSKRLADDGEWLKD